MCIKGQVNVAGGGFFWGRGGLNCSFVCERGKTEGRRTKRNKDKRGEVTGGGEEGLNTRLWGRWESRLLVR